MFGFLSSLESKFIAAVVAILILLAGYFYVKHLQSSLEAAQAKVATFEDVISAQKLAMDTLKKDIARMNEIQTDYGNRVSVIDGKVRNLADKFSKDRNGKPRDFAKDVAAQPDAMEIRINRATRDAHRCNEIVTGSPLTADERRGRVFNSICPEYMGGKK